MARKQPPVKTGDEVVLEIENYASEGEGVVLASRDLQSSSQALSSVKRLSH